MNVITINDLRMKTITFTFEPKRNLYKIILFVLLILSFVGVTLGQKQGKELIDSLKTELKTIKSETNKVNVLNSLSKAHWQTSDYGTAEKYARDALELSQNIKYRNGEAEAYKNIGVVNDYLGNYSEALKNYSISLEIYGETGDKVGLSATYHNIGVVYWLQGNYPEALKNYFNALKIREEIGDKKGIAYSNNSIGNIYSAQRDFSKALKCFEIALKTAEEIGDKENMASAYLRISTLHNKNGEYDEALKNAKESLKLYKELGYKDFIAGVYSELGYSYSFLGNHQEATTYMFKALKISEEIGNTESVLRSYFDIASIYYIQGNYPEVKKHLEKSMLIAKTIGSKGYISNNYGGLATIDSIFGNWKGAYENYKMYVLYRDSIYNEENTKKLTQTEMQYEFDKKESLAKAEQEKKDAITKLIRNVLIVGLLSIFVFAVVFLRQRNKIAKGKLKSDELLLNILPSEVAEELKEKGNTAAKQYDEVSILFTDFVHFTQTAEKLSPEKLVQELHECFTAFDNIIERNGLEKIKTIGDAYLAVCGLPVSNPDHAKNTVKAAMEIIDYINARKQHEKTFEIRIGIHSGSVVAGIVGVKKFAYDIWGDTVNTAARMEQNSEAGKVNISETTWHLVKDEFTCTHRGKIGAKGKGEIDMYFVNNNKV